MPGRKGAHGPGKFDPTGRGHSPRGSHKGACIQSATIYHVQNIMFKQEVAIIGHARS